MSMRTTQHFHHGLLLSTTKEKKRNSDKHTEIFLEFLIFPERNKLIKENKKEKNYLHGKAPKKQKKNGKSFWIFF